jgi:hypothetical protein
MASAHQNNARKNEKTINMLIAAIVVLTLLNGYLALNSYNNKRKNKILEAKRQETDSLYAHVSKELAIAAAALDSLKGKNAQLDSLIAIREQELAETRKQIDALLQKHTITLTDLNNAKKLVKELHQENNIYLQNITELNRQYKLLEQQKDSLNEALKIATEKTRKLSEEKKQLGKKALMGSLLKVENITGIGIRLSGSKETETNIAKKADKLKICFDVPAQRTADAGQKEIFIRIISPSGSTISIASQGSGILTDAETGEEVPYTTMASFEYEQKKKNICVYWQQNTTFTKGVYKISLYQQNYLIAESNFKMK